MSVRVMTWVFDHSPSTLGSRLVLLALADHAHDDGSKSFPAVETIAAKARMTRRAAQSALRKLESDGHIQATGKTRSGTTVYTIRGVVPSPPGGVVHDTGGVVHDTTSGVDSSPEPLTVKEPSGKKNGAEPIGFVDWLEYHCGLTGQRVPRPSKARAELARKFGVILGEGRSLEDVKLASAGAHSDAWLRERNLTRPENVLVFNRIDGLVEKGAKAAGHPPRAKMEKQSDAWAGGQL